MIINAFIDWVRSNSLASKIVLATYYPDSYCQKEEPGDNIIVLPTFTKAIENLFVRSFLYRQKKLKVMIGIIIILTLPLILKASKIFRGQIKQLVDELSHCDVVFFPGGNYISAPEGNSIFPTLDQLASIFYTKHILKKTVIILPQSIGPITNKWLRFLTRSMLEFVDIIMVREHISYGYLKEKIGLQNKNIFEAPDLAFLLNSTFVSNQKTKKNNIIGVTLRDWPGFSLDHKFMKVLKINFKQLLENGYQLILFSFSGIKGVEDDMVISKLMANTLNSEKVTIKNLSSMSLLDIKSIFSSLDFLIGMRHHSVILGGILGIPTIIIPLNQYKSYGVAEKLGLRKYLVELPSLKKEGLLKMIESLSKKRNRVGRELCTKSKLLAKEVEDRMNLVNKVLDS